MLSGRRVLPLALCVGLLTALGVAGTGQGAYTPRVVGGTDAPAGKYPSVAKVAINGVFGCTGTLIAPQWVITAGHCSSIGGAAEIALPIANPPSSFEVVIGGIKTDGSDGERVTVDRVEIPGSYLLASGYDTSLLHLSAPAKATPTPVAGAGYEGLYAPNVLEELAGFGTTASGGDAPAMLQQAKVPIVTDQSCAGTYSSFEAGTQLCAGYPEGGVDSCQGDSGGPLYGRTVDGRLLLVGATSYGNGCAQPNTPGVYARVGGDILRGFIRTNAPDGVLDAAAGAVTGPAETYDPATKKITTHTATGTTTTSSTPAGTTPAPTAFTASLAVDRIQRRTARTRGLRVRLRCSSACKAALSVQVSSATAKRLGLMSRTVVSKSLTRSGSGRVAFRIKLNGFASRRALAATAARLRVVGKVTPTGGKARTFSLPVRLTGRA